MPQKTGRAKSTLYLDVSEGLMVRPVSLGARCSGFPEHEVDAILSARICGASDADIRALVKRLHEARKQAFVANS